MCGCILLQLSTVRRKVILMDLAHGEVVFAKSVQVIEENLTLNFSAGRKRLFMCLLLGAMPSDHVLTLPEIITQMGELGWVPDADLQKRLDEELKAEKQL